MATCQPPLLRAEAVAGVEAGAASAAGSVAAIAALDALRRETLARNTLVATVMSNFGLDETLRSHGGDVLRTAVGDRYVIEAMVRENLNIGGEQSGHMIFRDFGTTGDGLVSALQILRILVETGKPLSELKSCLSKYPQAQRNLRVQRKPPLSELPEIQKLVANAEQVLAGSGRVLLRYSGTEPKIRLLIEGREANQINSFADEIAAALKASIGA